MDMNPNELILDRVRELIFTDLSDGHVLGRLTSLEDASLNTTAEGTDIVDSIGAVITTLYRAKTGEFTATNSLFSLDLAAQQFGSTKEVASEENKIQTPVSEVLTVNKDGKIILSHVPCNQIKYIYKLQNRSLAKMFTVGTTVSETEFTISEQEITVPTGVTGEIYVEYEYEADAAVKVDNNTDEFPEMVGVKIFCIFKDVCNENIKYAGSIVSKKAKLDPSSVQFALTSTGKHPFKVKFNKEWCDGKETLFSTIIAA